MWYVHLKYAFTCGMCRSFARGQTATCIHRQTGLSSQPMFGNSKLETKSIDLKAYCLFVLNYVYIFANVALQTMPTLKFDSSLNVVQIVAC